jgi:hypothetical protein
MLYIKSLNLPTKKKVLFYNKIWNFVWKQDYAALKGKVYELHRINGLISFGMGYTGDLMSSVLLTGT